jgi:hypothetical protein
MDGALTRGLLCRWQKQDRRKPDGCKVLRRTGGEKEPRPCGVSQSKPMALSKRLPDAIASNCALFLALGLLWLINASSIVSSQPKNPARYND